MQKVTQLLKLILPVISFSYNFYKQNEEEIKGVFSKKEKIAPPDQQTASKIEVPEEKNELLEKKKVDDSKEELIIEVFRFQQSANTTLSTLKVGSKSYFVLEDALRKKKIPKITAIPDGKYEVELRTEGTIHRRYLKKFGSEWHKGTLHLQNVPNFSYILIHIGNFEKDTQGCLLVGNSWGKNKNKDFEVYNSIKTYKEIYPVIRDSILSGTKVFVEIKNDESLKVFESGEEYSEDVDLDFNLIPEVGEK